MKILLKDWGSKNYNPSPSLTTLLGWRKTGQFCPPPKKRRRFADALHDFPDPLRTQPNAVFGNQRDGLLFDAAVDFGDAFDTVKSLRNLLHAATAHLTDRHHDVRLVSIGRLRRALRLTTRGRST